jgi:hypothetical protein
MGEPRLSVHDRVQVLQRLDGLATELNEIAAWLGGYSIETPMFLAWPAAQPLTPPVTLAPYWPYE